jgi:protein-tyrosine-phosphatase
MAAAFLTHLSQGAVDVRSAGSEPADRVNPAAVPALAEVGIDVAAEQAKILTNARRSISVRFMCRRRASTSSTRWSHR